MKKSAFTLFILIIIMGRLAIAFSPERATFSIKFKNEVSPYSVVAIFVLPEDILTLEIIDKTSESGYILEAPTQLTQNIINKKYKWKAPQEKGLYPLKIVHSESREVVTLNVFVMIPFVKFQGEYLNGYRIGSYPSFPFKELSIYEPPRGFIEVTRENENILVSPHFTLKQFLCKQNEGYPKYVVLRESLLLKLELILEKVNEKGYQCETLHIMSGYRTPYYNEIIGNVKYSRHLYGDAADIFIDQNPKDEMMDDLNNDGKMDYRDTAILYEVIDEMYGKAWYKPFMGGLARYKKTSSHGPFVHVDTRGFWARWGD